MQTVDLSAFNIFIPENGIVVAFDMYDAGQQYHYMQTFHMKDGPIITNEQYGWNICGIKGTDIKCFIKSPGGRWSHFEPLIKTIGAPKVELLIKVCND
ncbi:MAG: hypothetical protein ABIX01_13425 [Chitinophagaceae bacterium]